MTHQQARLLQFIVDYQRENAGASPSYAEMATAIDINSKAGVHRILGGLEEQGQIGRMPNRARSISVIQPAITVAAFRASFEQLIEIHGLDFAAGVLHDLKSELLPRLKVVA